MESAEWLRDDVHVEFLSDNYSNSVDTQLNDALIPKGHTGAELVSKLKKQGTWRKIFLNVKADELIKMQTVV